MSEFINGLKIDQPHEKSPSFVKGRVSFNVEKVIEALREHANDRGYVNADLCEGRNGLYLKINTYQQRGESGPPR